MPRTIVYAAAPGQPPNVPDDYFEKLLKYVPAEVIGLFMLLVTAWGLDERGVRWAIAVGAIATFSYLLHSASRLEPEKPKPRWFNYPLAVIAFLIWAYTFSPKVRAATWDCRDEIASGILVVTVFFLPLVDAALNVIFPRPTTL